MSELRVLRDLRELIKFIYSIEFPSDEKYNLQSQIRRAAVSVALNIREGNSYYDNNRKRFFNIALGSLREVDECMNISLALNYVPDLIEFSSLYWLCKNQLSKLSDLSTQSKLSEVKDERKDNN